MIRSIHQTRTDDSISQTIALEAAINAATTDADKDAQARAYYHERRVKAVKRYLRERANRKAGAAK